MSANTGSSCTQCGSKPAQRPVVNPTTGRLEANLCWDCAGRDPRFAACAAPSCNVCANK